MATTDAAAKKATHTPGPWRMTQDSEWPFTLTTKGPDGQSVARTDLWAIGSSDRTAAEANAREGNAVCIANEQLRAAAPDLLAACKLVLEHDAADKFLPGVDYVALRAAIAKAESPSASPEA